MPSTPPEMERLYYSIPQAAKLLGVSPNFVRALIAAGHLETTQWGTRRLIGRLTLRRFEEAHQSGTLLPNGTRRPS